MRSRRRSDQEVSTHGIDLAPMLDFCINLLIFFIITAVFIQQFGLVLNRPTTSQQTQKVESKLFVVHISDAGKISIAGRSVNVHAVRANVARQVAVNPGTHLLVIAAQGAPTGVLVQVVNQAHLAGVYNVTFATQK